MKLPAAVLATRDRYVAKFPLWNMPAGTPEEVAAAEERARQWSLGLASQVAWEHPGQGYGSKRADANRPISKDGLAQLADRLWVFDLLSGAGTGRPKLVPEPVAEDITGQVFVPVVGRDVIGNGVPVPGPTPTPPTPPSLQIPYDEGKSIQFGLGCNDVYAQSGKPFDAGMIAVHASRAAWDYYVGGLSWDASYRKHLNEFRAVYNLPPV